MTFHLIDRPVYNIRATLLESTFNIIKQIIGTNQTKRNILLLWKHKTNISQSGGKEVASTDKPEVPIWCRIL
jgi:hypothetical protein